MEQGMTVYQGTNCDLREPHCAACGSTKDGTSSTHLLQCSRCEMVHYCGGECQKKDYARHKKDCRDVQECKDRMETEAEPLKHYSQFGEEPSNLFETNVGLFWGIFDTRNYMRQRIALIRKLTELALDTQTKEAWTRVAEQYQECLRLNMRDNNGLRFAFPFVLLRLNRDDDAYCFCKFWITYDDWDDERETHSSSKVGDWIYPKQEGCRYLDVFKDCVEVKERGDLWSLLAFAVIKMRLVAVFEARTKAFEVASATHSSLAGQGGAEVENMRREIMGTVEQEQLLSEQGRQLDQLLDLVDDHNKIMVPALLHPGPLSSLPPPPYYGRGSPSEARMMLPDVVDVWNSIPGAAQYLARRLGTTTPSYSTDES